MVKNKKAQEGPIGMPFGIIFGLFLIIVFIVIAIIAVNYFLGVKNQVMILTFYDDLQQNLNKALSSQETNETVYIALPGAIDYVCFINFSAEKNGTYIKYYDQITGGYSEDSNIFLFPTTKAQEHPFYKLSHVNIANITAINNPSCISTKSRLRLVKGFYDKEIMIQEVK